MISSFVKTQRQNISYKSLLSMFWRILKLNISFLWWVIEQNFAFVFVDEFFIKPLFLRIFKVVCDVVQSFLAKVQQEPSDCIFHNLFGVWLIRDVRIKENFDENTIILRPIYSCRCIRKPFPIQRTWPHDFYDHFFTFKVYILIIYNFAAFAGKK